MNCFAYFIIMTRRKIEKVKHFPIGCLIQLGPTQGNSLIKWDTSNKNQKLSLQLNSHEFVVVFNLPAHSAPLRRNTRPDGGSQRDRLAHKVKRRSRRRDAGAKPPDTRCATPGAGCVSVAARVQLETGTNSRKTPADTAASAAAVAGWEGSPHLSYSQPRLGPCAFPQLQSDY